MKFRHLDFIIAGVQKGGTTALWQYLRQHQDIAFGQRKEMHFFDDETIDWVVPNYERLHAAYSGKINYKSWGDATPICTFWPPCLRRIHDYNPDIRLIVSLRDPVERAFSHWRMEMARAQESLSFSEAIRAGRRRLAGLSHLHPDFRVFSYVERGNYVEQLDRLFALFPTKNVLLLRQCDLLIDQKATLDRICAFLNVAPFASYPENSVFFSHDQEGSYQLPEADLEFLMHTYQKEYHILKIKYNIDFFN